MNQTFNKFILSLLTLLVLGCAQEPPAQEACNFVQNQFGRRVSWARLPVQFYAAPSISDRQFHVIREAMQVWNDHFDQPVFEMIGRAPQLPAPRINSDGKVASDGFNGLYIASPDDFEKSPFRDEQARASISFRGDFIHECDILVDSSEDFFYENEKSRMSQGRIHFKSLVVHELGHCLGLDHIEEMDSVMAPILPPGFNPSRVELSETDSESLACQY